MSLVRRRLATVLLAATGLVALPACGTAGAGDVHVRTEAGAVEGHALTSDEVTIATEAGAASLKFRSAPTLVRTTTTMGAVSVRVPRDTAYDVDVTTSVGTARVSVARDATSGHRIEVRTEVGGVAIEPAP